MIKLKNYPIFRNWCAQAPKISERIDLLSLGNKQKDCAVAAYCLDVGDANHLSVAMRVNSEATSEQWKNNAYANLELIMMDLIDQYNAELNMRDAAASNFYDFANADLCEESFSRIFRTDQATIDAGHKQSDF